MRVCVEEATLLQTLECCMLAQHRGGPALSLAHIYGEDLTKQKRIPTIHMELMETRRGIL